jgi:hypothetical protein
MLSRRKEPVAAPPSADPMAPLRELQRRIEQFRAELNDYVEAHCKEIKLGCDGVPLEAIKLTVTADSNCHCAITTKILNDRAVAIELERKQSGQES